MMKNQTFLDNGYTLVDGVKQNQKFDTFLIPTQADKDRLVPGNMVRIALENGDSSEKFWVKLTQKNEDGSFLCVVEQDLIITAHGIFDQDQLLIEPKHILTIYAEGHTPQPYMANTSRRNVVITCPHQNQAYIWDKPFEGLLPIPDPIPFKVM